MTAPQSPDGVLRAQKVTLADGEDQLVLAFDGDALLPDIPELPPTTITTVIEGPSQIGSIEFDS